MIKTGGQAVVEALEAWGVEVVFGIPGLHTLALYDALYKHPRIHHVTTRHEQGAGYMADGYARASGRVGVALSTTGPAALNALTPLGEAYADSSPLLLITSGPESNSTTDPDLGALHEMRDQFATLESVCGQGRRVESVEEIPQALGEAFNSLQRRRPRPYVLEVPLDLLEATAAVPQRPAILAPAPLAPQQDLEKAAALLRGATQPLIIAGRGAQDAAAALRQLAELLQAPVGLTVNGLGVLPADHPLCLADAGTGKLDGRRRNLGRNIGAWVERADLIFAVGTRLGERTVRAWDAEPSRLIHLDIDPRVVGRHYPAEVGLVGAARENLSALINLLGQDPGPSTWCSAKIDAPVPAPEEGLFAEILAALRQSLDRNAILTNDMTLACYRARRLFPVYAPRSFLSPHYYGTLGFAVPAAIGAKIACPEQQVVALCGDGGFLFTGQELATARQQRLSLPIVLCNDNCYTAIRQGQERDFGGRYTGVDLENPDFVLFAHSFGIASTRVKSRPDLERALREALWRDGPTLIEVSLPEFEL